MVQTNWVQTQPFFPTVYSFTGTSGLNLNGLVFGDHQSTALQPCAVVDNSSTSGYAETGTWSTVVGGLDGTNRVARTTHGTGNTATATFTFSGLSTGMTYDVYITYAGKPIYSKAAPFSVNDGARSSRPRSSTNRSSSPSRTPACRRDRPTAWAG